MAGILFVAGNSARKAAGSVNFHTEIKLNVIISLSADDEWARQRLIVETCAWLSERELLSGAATMTSTGQVLERISHFQLHCSALVS